MLPPLLTLSWAPDLCVCHIKQDLKEPYLPTPVCGEAWSRASEQLSGRDQCFLRHWFNGVYSQLSSLGLSYHMGKKLFFSSFFSYPCFLKKKKKAVSLPSIFNNGLWVSPFSMTVSSPSGHWVCLKLSTRTDWPCPQPHTPTHPPPCPSVYTQPDNSLTYSGQIQGWFTRYQ